MDEDGDFDDDEEWQGISANDAPPSEPTDTSALPAPIESAAPSAPATRYVPPHLRNKVASGDGQDAEVIAKLTKKLKGLLNRMTEQNLGSIIEGVEETYRQNRRHDVTSTLTKLIIEGTSSHALLLDSYVVLHAAFVAALHKIVGVEFAAYFVQTLVAEYERHRAEAAGASAHQISPVDAATDASTTIDTNALSTTTDPSNHDSTTDPSNNDSNTDLTRDGAGKECSNLIVLISELYNFQVVSCVLVYDIVRSLLGGGGGGGNGKENGMDELDVELLLKVVRNSGQQLRADDPSALKDIIQIVQGKVEGKGGNLSSRTKFMIETLTNLKNNKAAKSKKGQQGQTGGNEAVERMKKFLNGMAKKRHVLAHEPLRVTLEDLHSAESRGKWWLVGAAWGGDPLVERQGENGVDGSGTGLNSTIGSSNVTTKPKESAESKLLKLARKQGMNTDIRRSIFVVLMSSDDYVDACERLGQLNLTEVQQREIVRVLLHCCGNEAAYNPYYALVGQHLCRQSHSYKITLQFCLWDFLRDLGETRVGGAEVVKNLGDANDDSDDEERAKKISPARMRNVAWLYAWWIAKDATSLTILKPVDFTVLKPRGRAFLRELLVQIFVASQTASPVLGATPQTRNRGAVEEVFIRAARVEALAMGLVYFITQVVMKEATADDAEGKFVKWAGGVAKETLRTGLDVVPGLTDDL
ncbi:armadillo-type protein [Schizophyllum commune]